MLFAQHFKTKNLEIFPIPLKIDDRVIYDINRIN